MAKRERGIHRLKPRDVEKLGNGLHPDGGGLYLQVKGNGRSWLFRTRDNWMGLGSTNTITLDEARERARMCRQQILDGIDPIAARNATQRDQQLAAAKDVTFRQCADEWMKSNAITWDPDTADGIKRRLEMFAYPKFDDGNLPIQKFDMRNPDSDAVDLVHKALEPLWKPKKDGGQPPTAQLLQQNIDGVLNWARAKRYIAGDIASSMNGPLGILLPKIKDFHEVTHHAALHFKEIGAFMAKLRECRDNTGSVVGGYRGTDQAPPRCKVCSSPHRAEIEAARKARASLDNLAKRFGINRNSIWQHCKLHLNVANVNTIRRPASAYAIEFIALTAVRKTQALEAKWTEFPDRHGANPQWHCPWQRTKTGKKRKRDHVIPLSVPALAVLDTMEEMQKANGIKSEYVFPGGRGGQSSGPMTSSSVVKFLKESFGRSDLTIHGFRTTFRSWAKQYFPEKAAIAELCLDHAVPALEAIYGRDADLGELCRPLLDAWGAYCERPAPLPAAKVHDISEARKRA